MTERSLKEKEILFPGSYDNVKINESTKAFRLIDDQCSWVTINLTAPTTSTRYLKRIPSLQAHRATAAPARRRAGHGSMSARARGAPPCKKYNLERGNRPSIQLPTPSPIISSGTVLSLLRELRISSAHPPSFWRKTGSGTKCRVVRHRGGG